MTKPYFEPVVIRGQTFDLSHLDPFSFEFLSKKAKKNLRVHVTFSNHCFTKKIITEEHIDGDPVFDAGSTRPRMFCEIRYRLSLDLRSVIDSLNDARVKVWETAAQRNWAHSITIDDPSGPYHIFFEVRRASRDRRNYQDINLVVEYDPPCASTAYAYAAGERSISSGQSPRTRNINRIDDVVNINK